MSTKPRPVKADHTLAAGGLNRDDRDATSVRRHERTASRDLQASSHNPPFVRPPTPPSPTFGRGPERTSPKPPSPTNFVASLRESRRSPNSSQRQSPTPWHPQAERRQSPHALSGSPTYAEAAKARRPSGERPARPQSPFGKSPDPAGSARGQFARQKTPPRSKSTVNHYETDVAKARSATAAAARGKTPPARMSNNVGVERRERPPSPARANRTMVDASCQTRDESGAADGDAEVGDSFTSMIQSQSGLLMSLQAQMEMLAERGHSRGPKFGRDGDSDGEGDADVEVRSLSLSEDGPVIHNGAGHLSARRNAPDPVAMLSDGVHTVGSDTTSGGGHSAAVTQKETASSQCSPPHFADLSKWLSLLSHDDRLDKVPEDHNDPSSPNAKDEPVPVRPGGDKGGKFVRRRAVKARRAASGDDLRRLGKVDKDDGPPMLSPRSLSGSELSIGASEHSAFDSVSSPSSANGSRITSPRVRTLTATASMPDLQRRPSHSSAP